MAFNGSGTFARLYNWTTDKANGVKVRADRSDAELDGIATGLSNTICRDGQSTISANIPFNNKKITGLADATADTDALNRQAADARYARMEAGTKTVFNQTSAPTGWTKDTTTDNAALRLVSGTVGSGGTANFTSAFAARTIAQSNLPSVNFVLSGSFSGSISGSTNTTGSHTHGYNSPNAPDDILPGTGNLDVVRSRSTSANTDSDGSHSHTVTGTCSGTISGTAASGGSGTALDFAVKYRDVIIATKD